MRTEIALIVALLAGCASTGITPMDRDTFMVAKTSAGGGFASASGPTAEVYQEANAFCAGKGQQVETVKLDAKDGLVFIRSANASLQFRCVLKS